MLENIINKMSVNNLSCVPKSDVHIVKNLQVITRHGTRIGYDNDIIEPIKHIEKNDYPNSKKQKDLFKDAVKVFEEIVANEDKEQAKNHIIKEFLHLLTNEEVPQRLVDIIPMLKDESTKPRMSKIITYMSSNTQNDFDPQVDLQINESLIPKVVLDFGSQVNILTKDTWEKLGRPQLVKSDYYLKLVDQGLIEPLGLCRNVETTIMGISTRTDFKVIEPREGRKSYPSLVSHGPER